MAAVSMEAAAYFEYSNGIPGSSLFVDGDLVLKQREALPWFGQRTVYEKPLVDMQSFNADDYDMVRIFCPLSPHRLVYREERPIIILLIQLTTITPRVANPKDTHSLSHPRRKIVALTLFYSSVSSFFFLWKT